MKSPSMARAGTKAGSSSVASNSARKSSSASPIVYRYLGILGVDRETVSRRAEDYFSHA